MEIQRINALEFHGIPAHFWSVEFQRIFEKCAGIPWKSSAFLCVTNGEENELEAAGAVEFPNIK